MTRRTLLQAATRIAALGSIGGIAPLVRALQNTGAPPDPRLIVRSRTPQDLETPVNVLTSWITPNDAFFVRSHLPTPNVERSAWTLAIKGSVDRPLTLRLDELRAFPQVTSVVTLE